MAGYVRDRDEVLARLRAVEEGVRVLAQMVGSDAQPLLIVESVAETTRELREIALALLGDHLIHCLAAGGRAADAPVEEVLTAITRLVHA